MLYELETSAGRPALYSKLSACNVVAMRRPKYASAGNRRRIEHCSIFTLVPVHMRYKQAPENSGVRPALKPSAGDNGNRLV